MFSLWSLERFYIRFIQQGVPVFHRIAKIIINVMSCLEIEINCLKPQYKQTKTKEEPEDRYWPFCGYFKVRIYSLKSYILTRLRKM